MPPSRLSVCVEMCVPAYIKRSLLHPTGPLWSLRQVSTLRVAQVSPDPGQEASGTPANPKLLQPRALSASPAPLALHCVHPEYQERCRTPGAGRVAQRLVGIWGITVSNGVANVVVRLTTCSFS